MMVAMGPAPTAGSFFKKLNKQGIKMAIKLAKMMVKNKEIPKIKPIKTGAENQIKEIRERIIPKIRAIKKLTLISRKRYFLILSS